jgi:hypothetical protein
MSSGDLDLKSPLAYLGTAVLMMGAALGAMWRPARRALAADPTVSL